MELKARLGQLAKLTSPGGQVVSVYLNTRWADEHQRDRVRLFLKNQLRDARTRGGADLQADLDWIQSEAEAIIAQARFSDAQGVALFACGSLDLREVLSVRVPFEDVFVVDDSPFLRPLAALVEKTPAAVVVFVDRESARLIPADPGGAGEEVVLESEVPGQHRRGGWALLAQSRYERHIEAQRGRHFEAVAEAILHLSHENGFGRIVLAGEPRNLAAFRQHLPPEVSARVAGQITASRHEPAAAILGRATEHMAQRAMLEAAEAVDEVLTAAAKGGPAVAGLAGTLKGALRGAVRRMYLLQGFAAPGRVCIACGTLHLGVTGACPGCGGDTREAELGEALVDRVLAAGGEVNIVALHQGLVGAGGIAALLRYPLEPGRVA